MKSFETLGTTDDEYIKSKIRRSNIYLKRERSKVILFNFHANCRTKTSFPNSLVTKHL